VEVTADQLRQILPQAGARADVFCEPLNVAMAEVGVDTPHEIASFLAQIGHESGQLQRLEENLNYSDKGLLATWPKRFDLVTAARCARKPEVIANRVYANRMENGDEASGDGWRYRGRGLIQVTFKRNYRRCGEYLGLDLLGDPALLLEPANAARSAGWYWKVAGLDAHDDDDDARSESRIVNGGEHGLADRQAILTRALEVLA